MWTRTDERLKAETIEAAIRIVTTISIQSCLLGTSSLPLRTFVIGVPSLDVAQATVLGQIRSHSSALFDLSNIQFSSHTKLVKRPSISAVVLVVIY